MTVDIKNGVVTITMTAEELGSLRYTLAEGADKLEGTARFLESMKTEHAQSAGRTAKDARAVNEALEAAVQKYCRTPTTEGS
jgi:hypothetical protein